MKNITTAAFVAALLVSGCTLAQTTHVEDPHPDPDAAVSDETGTDAGSDAGMDASVADDVAVDATADIPAPPDCPLVVERDPELPDGDPEHPLAFGAERWVIEQFRVRATCAAADLARVILRDLVPGEETAARYFTNLALMRGDRHVGAEVSILTDLPDTWYVYTPPAPIRILPGGVETLYIMVNVKAEPQGAAEVINGSVPFGVTVEGTDLTTGNSLEARTDDLQRVYLADSGCLRVTTYTPSFDRNQLCMAMPRVDVAHLELVASPVEDIAVTRMQFRLVTDGTPAVYRNLYLVLGGSDVRLSETVVAAGADGYVRFEHVELAIPAGGSMGLAIHADTEREEFGARSGQTAELILEVEGVGEPGIVAYGQSSGALINGESLHIGSGERDEPVSIGRHTLYRGAFTIEHFPGAPAGPQPDDWIRYTVAQFALRHDCGEAVTILGMNLDVASTIAVQADGPYPLVSVSRGVPDPSQILAIQYFYPPVGITDTAWPDGDFRDVTIFPGGAAIIWVVINDLYPRTRNTLTVGLDEDDVLWTDGSSIVARHEDLPLLGNTLVF